MMNRNLIEVGQNMARAKKFDANWLFFGIPAAIAWLVWLTWELYQQDSEAARYMIYGTICGAVLGVILGFRMHSKTQTQYQEIIDQIEDITANE
jgi:ABC-type nitrate/sulfonate/bicarbonate transport system permease component